MTKLSIKAKVTLWYALLMIGIVGLVLAAVFFISDTLLTSSVESRLLETVEANRDEIDYDDGILEVDDDVLLVEEGIYVSFYGTDGVFIDGSVPASFNESVSFSSDETQTISSGGTSWAVYDRLISVESYGDVWIRGIASFSEAESTMRTMLTVALIVLPFMVIIATIGGYLITKRAFAPVKRITQSAETISGGNELSQRIALGDGKDEIYTLANTFDHMFDRLQQSFEIEKQFTSDASHELRTPVSVIISQCEYALEQAATEQELKEALTVILGQSRKMSKLISQLLFLSRTDRNTQLTSKETVNISELAEVIVEEQHMLASQKKIDIRSQIEPDIILQADETMIMSLLINLISNAVKYGKQGGYVSVQLTQSGNTITGVIQDNGIGIPESQQKKIWDRFYQVDTARTAAKESGVGLGLSMVKWIIQSHNGTIAVKSRLSKGSTFTFTLPKI